MLLRMEGARAWKRAAEALEPRYAASWQAYEEWARTPGGRVVLAGRWLRQRPYRLRVWLAELIYPGDYIG